MGAVIVGSGLMAVGGAFLTLSSALLLVLLRDGEIGRGWICIALVVFGAGAQARLSLARFFSPPSTRSRSGRSRRRWAPSCPIRSF